MGNLSGFNPTEHEASQSFDPVPAGHYVAIMTDSEWRPIADQTEFEGFDYEDGVHKPNKNHPAGCTGKMLKCTFEIVDGPYARRLLWLNLNLVNKNSDAVKIALSFLSSLSRATGVSPKDSKDYHNKVVKLKVEVRPPNNGYDASNNIKGISAAEGHVPSVPAVAAQQPANGGKVTPPWQNQQQQIFKKGDEPPF